MNKLKTSVGLDVGGTNISGVLIDESGKILSSFSRASNFRGTDYEKNIFEIIERLLKGNSAHIEGIGIGIPGTVDSRSGVIKNCPAFRWNDVPLQEQIENRFGIRAHIENDVNAWTISEKRLGVAKSCDNFVMITIGTGIGCGLWLNGQIYRGSSFESGEIGYMPLDPRAYGGEYKSSDFGFFESRASAASICNAYKRQTSRDVDCKTIFEYSRQNDAVADHIVSEAYDYLGLGISCISCLINPELIVIGGGISQEGQKLVENISLRVRRLIPIRTNLCLTGVGANGGAIGSGLHAFSWSQW